MKESVFGFNTFRFRFQEAFGSPQDAVYILKFNKLVCEPRNLLFSMPSFLAIESYLKRSFPHLTTATDTLIYKKNSENFYLPVLTMKTFIRVSEKKKHVFFLKNCVKLVG